MQAGSIAVVTGASNALAELLALSGAINRAYCIKHHYRFIPYDFENNDSSWPKLEVIHQTLQDKTIEYVLWIDADAIITNDDILLSDLIAKYLAAEGLGLALTCDLNGPNAGTLLIKNTPMMHAFLWVCAGVGHYRHRNAFWAEQEAIREFVLYPPYRDMVVYLDQRVMNSQRNDLYSDGRPLELGMWRSGDFILHLGGMSTEKRVKFLRDHLASLPPNAR